MALAFDPETRASRLTYWLITCRSASIGDPVDDVRTKFAASQGEPPVTLNTRKIDLSPSDTDRLLGANQAAGKRWTHGWKPHDHAELVVVVRNTNRWAARSAAAVRARRRSRGGGGHAHPLRRVGATLRGTC